MCLIIPLQTHFIDPNWINSKLVIALVKNKSNFLSTKEDEPKAVIEPFSRKSAHHLNNKWHKKKNKKGQQSKLDDCQSKSARVAKRKGGGKPQEQPKESHKTKMPENLLLDWLMLHWAKNKKVHCCWQTYLMFRMDIPSWW